MGNTGFTTQYAHSDPIVTCGSGNHVFEPLGCEGTYLVVDDPSTTHAAFSNCNDHTSGSGNMMFVNGANSLSEIWCQTVNVTPNTDYAFTAWATSVNPASPAILQFSIDGVLIGNNFNLSGVLCQWESFYALWNSGGATSIEICVTNQNLAGGGNDFALDDIFFGELCTEEAEFTVTIPEIDLFVDPYLELDFSESSTIISSFSTTPFLYYDWFTSNGNIVSSTSEANIEINEAGFYELLVTDQFGCTAYAYAEVVDNRILPGGLLEGELTLDCSRRETELRFYPDEPNTQIRWTGLEEDSTSYQVTYSQPGDYQVILLNDYNCKDTIDFTITEDRPTLESRVLDNPPIRCSGDSTFISIEIEGPYQSILWSGGPIDSLSTDSLTAYVTQAGTYYYTLFFGNGCSQIDSVEILSDISPLPYDLDSLLTLNCRNSVLPVNIQSDSSFSSVWTFNNTLVESDTLLVDQPGLYWVEILDQNLCTYRDSNRITEDFTPSNYSIEIDSIDCLNNRGFATLSTDSSNVFQWLMEDSTQLVSDTLFSSEALTVKAIVQGPNFCSDTSTIQIPASIDIPDVQVTYDSITCDNREVSIRAEVDIEDSQVDWILPSGEEQSGTNFTSVEAGLYQLEVTSPKGCTFETTFEVSIDTLYPEITLSGNTINCIDTLSILNANTTSNLAYSHWLNTAGIDSLNNSTAIASTEGWYIFEALGQNGCLTKDSIFITAEQEAPMLPGINDQLLDCSNTSILISSEASDSLETIWTNEANTFFSQDQAYIFEEAGNYLLTIINPTNGCESRETFSIEMDTTPIEFTITSNDITCLDTVSLIELSSNTDISSIDFDLRLEQANHQSFITREGGTYTFTVQGSNQCSRTKEVEINIDTIAPRISTYSDSLKCNKTEVALSLDIDQEESSLNWTGPNGFSSTLRSPIVNQGGVYTIEALNPTNGCRSLSTLEIITDIPEIRFDPYLDQGVCYNDPSSISILNIEGGAPPYQTQITDPFGRIQEGQDLTLSGLYILEVTDDNTCTSIDSIWIEQRSPINIDLGSSLDLIKGEEAQLEAITNLDWADIASIEWIPEDYLSCVECLDPMASPEDDITYTLILTDQYGCQVMDSVSLRLRINVEIKVPNIFSPNQDNNNDYFTIYTNEKEEVEIIETFLIYDRWGEVVFHAEDIPINEEKAGWNGQFNNEEALTGVYIYMAKILLKSGETRTLTGDVTLIR